MTWPLAVDPSTVAQDWGTLIVTVVLAGITGWYAYLTKQLSASAKESAQSAKDAAQASERAVQVAESNVRLELSFNPVFGPSSDGTAGMRIIGALLHCNGPALNLHGATLESVQEWRAKQTSVPVQMDSNLQPSFESMHMKKVVAYPVRIHNGESLYLVRGEVAAGDPTKVVAMTIVVNYTLDETSDPRPLRVQWNEPVPWQYDSEQAST